jgi:penicillin-binding protein 2
MDLFAPIKDHHQEKRLFVGRIVLSVVTSTVLLAMVVARLVQLQVFDHEVFDQKSQGNRIRIEAVPPIRGLILDRKGRVLAENLPAYQLELIPEQVSDIDETLLRLEQLALIDNDDIDGIKALARRGPRFKPVTLRFRLSDDEISRFALQRHRFPGSVLSVSAAWAGRWPGTPLPADSR